MRWWHRNGEIIDLHREITEVGPTWGPVATSAVEHIADPVGRACATEWLRAGLSPQHIVAGLVEEFDVDEHTARAAIRAAERSLLSVA